MRREEKIRLIMEFNEVADEYGVQPLHPLLVGVSGSGKTATAKQILPSAKVIILQAHLPEDIAGLPDKIKIEDEQYVVQVPPLWFREGAELIFDETDKAGPGKISVLLYLLSNKGLSLIGKTVKEIKIILCAQIESGFLERLNMQDAVFAALARRVVIVPCYEAEVAEYNRLKWLRKGIRIKRSLMETEGDKMLKEFRYQHISEALRDYIIAFFIWLIEKEKDIDKAKEVVKEIFYYVPIDDILNDIEFDGEVSDKEIKFLIESMMRDSNVEAGEKIYLLAKHQNKIRAIEFYAYLINIYPKLSIDERAKFLNDFNESVLMTEEMFMDSDDEAEQVARYHAATTIILKERDGEQVEDEIKQEFKEEIEKLLEMEKQLIGGK